MAKVALFLVVQFTILWAPRWAHTLRYYFSYEEETMLWYLMNLGGLVCIYLNAALTPFTIVISNRIFRHQLGKVGSFVNRATDVLYVRNYECNSIRLESNYEIVYVFVARAK